MSRLAIALAIVLFSLTLAGCGVVGQSDLPPRAPAQVKVLYQGRPVAGANVTFVPEVAKSRPAIAVTDALGEAQLRTFGENDGAIPGAYKVAIQKTVVKRSDDPAANLAPPADPSASSELTPTEHLLPEKYAAAETSGLEATVSASGENRFTFELTD